MHWNHRIIKETVPDMLGGTSEIFSIREVYYANDGTIVGWSDRDSIVYGETRRELVTCLSHIIRALARPVLDTSDPNLPVELTT